MGILAVLADNEIIPKTFAAEYSLYLAKTNTGSPNKIVAAIATGLCLFAMVAKTSSGAPEVKAPGPQF